MMTTLISDGYNPVISWQFHTLREMSSGANVILQQEVLTGKLIVTVDIYLSYYIGLNIFLCLPNSLKLITAPSDQL